MSEHERLLRRVVHAERLARCYFWCAVVGSAGWALFLLVVLGPWLVGRALGR